jgi:hypothetical protein
MNKEWTSQQIMSVATAKSGIAPRLVLPGGRRTFSTTFNVQPAQKRVVRKQFERLLCGSRGLSSVPPICKIPSLRILLIATWKRIQHRVRKGRMTSTRSRAHTHRGHPVPTLHTVPIVLHYDTGTAPGTVPDQRPNTLRNESINQ